MPRGNKLGSAIKGFILIFAALTTLAYLDVVSRQAGQATMRAAIIDPLYPEDPGNHDEMAALLAASGYEVDSFRGEEVTPELLRRMGAYSVLVLRVHSTCSQGRVWFFTGEAYNPDKYVLEQVADEVHRARPSLGSEYIFAVGSDYVSRHMKGDLIGATVILMGCDGLAATDLAQAFLDSGAEAYVSWDGPVSLGHTDRATLCLLEALTAKNMTLGEALAHANAVAGPDPDYNSSLLLYPGEAACRVIV